MSVDRELLKEVTQELWNTVKKLRPEIDRQTRLQLVLKALLTIGDLPDQMQAAMVVGVCAEMDKSDVDNDETNSQTKDSSCLLYTSPSPRDRIASRMPSSA